MAATAEDRWYTDDCAAFLGISPGTFRTYRRPGRIMHNPPPPPDGYDGNRPYWHPATMIAWKRSRLGRGHWVKKPRQPRIAKRVKWSE